MKNIIISFKTRNSIYNLNNLLKQNGIPTNIINTPSSIGSSCGLSIKTDLKYLNNITFYIKNLKFSDFNGIFIQNLNNSFAQYQKIY